LPVRRRGQRRAEPQELRDAMRPVPGQRLLADELLREPGRPQVQRELPELRAQRSKALQRQDRLAAKSAI
jgi:hypothetical protein